MIVIYTDGACINNPGPGGWAAIICYPGFDPIELMGGEPHTTNNRMELRAAIEALIRVRPGEFVTVVSDSKLPGRRHDGVVRKLEAAWLEELSRQAR